MKSVFQIIIFVSLLCLGSACGSGARKAQSTTDTIHKSELLEDGLFTSTYSVKKDNPEILEGDFAVKVTKTNKKWITGSYANNQRTGTWRYYNKWGRIDSLGEYVKDIKSGSWQYNFGDNTPRITAEYKDGLADGKWTHFNTDGSLNCVMNYAKGLREGESTFYNIDGTVQMKGAFKNDKKNGTWEYKYSNGQLAKKETYENGLVVDKLVKSYYQDGSLAAEQIYENGLLAGACKAYAPENGDLISVQTYKAGKADGTHIRYYAGGVVMDEMVYDMGKLTSYAFYSESKKAIEVGNYKNGNGLLKRYNAKGKLLSEVNYKNYLKDGLGKYFHENGQVRKEGKEVAGKKVGNWKFYKEDGTLYEEIDFTAQPEEERLNKNTKGNLYSVVEVMPEFPGGQAALFTFLATNVRYPGSAREAEVEGVSYVSYIVDRYGFVSDIKIKKGFNEACDYEALRVVSLLPRWTPGFQRGTPARVAYTLPLRFKLQ